MALVSEDTSEMRTAEATELIREIASPVPVKVALHRVATELKGWSANRIRDVFHADPRVRLTEDEVRELRAAAQRKREADGRAELQDALERIERYRAALRALGADVDV